MIQNQTPAYITIVEGPPPVFREANHDWLNSVLEGEEKRKISMCEVRTADGPKLVRRCQDAWRERRRARLNFPTGEGSRDELDIVAIRWENAEEGHKLVLWLKRN